jgi:hypothetical protein
VRCGVEFLPAAILGVLSLSVFLLCFLFPSFPSYAVQARTRISVCIRPCCINALGLRETPSRLGLHNNALSLRESTSRLGLHNNALNLRELRHDLVSISVLSLWGAQMLL